MSILVYFDLTTEDMQTVAQLAWDGISFNQQAAANELVQKLYTTQIIDDNNNVEPNHYINIYLTSEQLRLIEESAWSGVTLSNRQAIEELVLFIHVRHNINYICVNDEEAEHSDEENVHEDFDGYVDENGDFQRHVGPNVYTD